MWYKENVHESSSSVVFVNNTTNIVTSKKSCCKATKSLQKVNTITYQTKKEKKRYLITIIWYILQWKQYFKQSKEAATGSVLWKVVFLKMSPNSYGNTCVVVSFKKNYSKFSETFKKTFPEHLQATASESSESILLLNKSNHRAKQVDISESNNINQSISMNRFDPIEALIFIPQFFVLS